LATKQQADILIDNYLLNKEIFFTPHPLATVGKNDSKFELRMWRGPVWNSMTYWAAKGCIKYARKNAAKLFLENALNETNKQFLKTGTIWEFYDPLGGDPRNVKRKPQTPYNKPCKDYLGIIL